MYLSPVAERRATELLGPEQSSSQRSFSEIEYSQMMAHSPSLLPPPSSGLLQFELSTSPHEPPLSSVSRDGTLTSSSQACLPCPPILQPSAITALELSEIRPYSAEPILQSTNEEEKKASPENLLRRKIMDIHADPEKSIYQKAKNVQLLMMSKWSYKQSHSSSNLMEETQPHISSSSLCSSPRTNSLLDESDPLTETVKSGKPPILTEKGLQKSYHADGKSLGCAHYKISCKIWTPCCQEWYACRHCHDESVTDHTLQRSSIQYILCQGCQTIQPRSQVCSNKSCGLSFSTYYCSHCPHWDTRSVYHCFDCGLCRLGHREDYFHCKKCACCLLLSLQDRHRCLEKSLHCNCPICGEYLFTSSAHIQLLPCGHPIHSTCLNEYVRNSYHCPICWKSVGDMSAYFKRLDSLLQNQKMPDEYKDVNALVLCNDCEQRSYAPYHFIYHKCQLCGSYNTSVMKHVQGMPSSSLSSL